MMSNMNHFQGLAAAARRQADEATLPSVRERCERSANAWDAIVLQMTDTAQLASANQAAKQAG